MYVEPNGISPQRYDVFVVGSGLACYALAQRLSEAKKRILILETGGRDFNVETQARFSKIFGRGHFDGSHWPQHSIRAFGGTSAVWTGICTPLAARDFVDWPIRRDQLSPYYRLAAGYLRRKERFLTFSAPSIKGFVYRPMSFAPPLQIAQEPALLDGLPGVDISLGVTVTALRSAPDRGRITKFVLSGDGGFNRSIALKEGQSIVLAAGGIGNAQILLNSFEDGAAAVGNERDMVGRHLMEHPHVYGAARFVASATFKIPRPPADFGAHVDVLEPDEDCYSNLGDIDVSMEITKAEKNHRDPVEQFVLEHVGAGAAIYDISLRSEMAASRDNRVMLAEGYDPSGLRRVRAVCYVGSETFQAIDKCLEAFSDSLKSTGPSRLLINNGAIIRNISGGGHIMGTTRMGASPNDSVVDADCRVHGYRNLFIAGSSVFPKVGHANPTLTIMALSARLGDRLGGL